MVRWSASRKRFQRLNTTAPNSFLAQNFMKQLAAHRSSRTGLVITTRNAHLRRQQIRRACKGHKSERRCSRYGGPRHVSKTFKAHALFRAGCLRRVGTRASRRTVAHIAKISSRFVCLLTTLKSLRLDTHSLSCVGQRYCLKRGFQNAHPVQSNRRSGRHRHYCALAYRLSPCGQRLCRWCRVAWNSSSEPLSAARSHRKRCTSLRRRRFITRHLHRFTSGHPCTSHPSTLDRVITGVRIEVIDASDLQPLVSVSNEKPGLPAGPGLSYFRVRGLRHSLVLSFVWIMGAS